MAKTRQEERPPVELPLARLFLDDLEELARIFVDAHTQWGNLQQEGCGVTYRVDEWECTTIQDLKELGRYRTSFEMELDQAAGPKTYIYTARHCFAWGAFGFPPEGEWAIYGQILGVVSKRQVLRYPWRRPTVVFQTSFEYGGLSASLKRHGLQIAIAVASSITTLIAVGGARAIWQYFHHSK
jgi:hypothetical protein